LNRIILTLVLLLSGANSLLAFTATFPDSAVVITEFPYTFAGMHIGLRTLARDSRATLYAAYSVTDEIRVSRSTDNGASWSLFATPGRQIDWQDQLLQPWIEIDRGDTIYVAWLRTYADTAHGGAEANYWSKYNGISWTPQETLTQDVFYGGWTWSTLPTLAIGPQNQVYAVWAGGESLYGYRTIVFTYLTPQGWHWPIEDVGEYTSQPTSLVADVNGSLHLGYGNFSHALYRKRGANGSWGPIEDLSISPSRDTVYGAAFVTVCPGDTIPHAVFGENSGPGPYRTNRIYYRYKPDSAWSSPFEVVPFHQYWTPYSCRITSDRQENLYAAWELEQTYGGGNVAGRNIWMREKEDAAGWGDPFKVTSDTILPGATSGYINMIPNLGFPVTENGVDITWLRMYFDSTQTRYYLMYKRLPSLLGVEQEKEKVPPREPELTLSPRPNPAKGEVELVYGIPKQEMVNLTVYNLMGERVRTLLHGSTSPGVYRIKWNGKDEKLKEAPSGTYFFQLTVGEKQVIKKGTFIR